MSHLTPEEIERFASRRSAASPHGTTAAHLVACARCRKEVEALRDVVAFLEGLTPHRPTDGFEERVARRIDFAGAALDRRLAQLPEWSPAPAFASDVLAQVDLPHPALDRALSGLRTWSPAPAFASAVMARVRLPVPWPERLLRFARRRRAALATAGAATLTVSGGAAAWLFGAQGLAPGQLLAVAFSGARTVLVDAMLAAGRLAYRFGLVDAGGSIADRINPTAALGSLALSSLVGLASLWYMARLFRQPLPRRVRIERAA